MLRETKVSDLVVIANKTPVLATVQDAHRAGMAWRPGSLSMQLQPVTLVDQQKQPLRAQISSKGGPTGAVADWSRFVLDRGGGGLLLLPFAPLGHGNEAVFPKGLISEAATSGEILLDRSAVAAAQPPRPDKNRSGARVTIYFLPHRGSPSPVIWCGTVNVGKAHSGRKVSFNLPAGRYSWHLGLRGSTLSVQAEDGSEYYLKVIQTDLPRGGVRMSLAEIEHDVGELEATDAEAVEGKDVPDVSKFDLAQVASGTRPHEAPLTLSPATRWLNSLPS